MSTNAKRKRKRRKKTAESLIGFSFFSFSCPISHDRGIGKKNLYDDNDNELVRKDQSFYPLHYSFFLFSIGKKKENRGEQHSHIETT
jgi:hypothetical protein